MANNIKWTLYELGKQENMVWHGFHENYYQKPELPHETKEYELNNKEKVKIPVFNGFDNIKTSKWANMTL